LTIEELNQASILTRKKVIARSQLAEAEEMVLEEAQSGIALAKRAITSYVDSNFDSAHISNVAVTLNTVRGGLNILGYKRASAVLKSCIAFIEDHIKDSDAGGQRHQLLETLADALISLEYYLMELEVDPEADEKILEVAEESLDALGFAVETEV
jgi:chemotaxis protein histidine kinase CheA